MVLNEFLKMFFVSDCIVIVNVVDSVINSFYGRLEDVPESLRVCEVLNFGAHLDRFVINVRTVKH